jgi:hypothetical protein
MNVTAHLLGGVVPPLFAPVHPAGEPEHGQASGHGEERSHQQVNCKAAHSRKSIPSPTRRRGAAVRAVPTNRRP